MKLGSWCCPQKPQNIDIINMKKKSKREITCSIWKKLWSQNKESRWEKPKKKKKKAKNRANGCKKDCLHHMGNKIAEL